MKPKSIAALILAALPLAVGRTAAVAEEPATFQVVARDGRLVPDRLDVPANTRFKLALRNESRAPVEFENLDLRVEKVLAPGASSFVVIRSLAPGSYKFVDEFHADTAQLLLIAK